MRFIIICLQFAEVHHFGLDADRKVKNENVCANRQRMV